jgi:hypothetical protein
LHGLAVRLGQVLQCDHQGVLAGKKLMRRTDTCDRSLGLGTKESVQLGRVVHGYPVPALSLPGDMSEAGEGQMCASHEVS